MTIVNEDLLDQLADLQRKRLTDIYDNGERFHLNGMEATLQGLHDNQKGTVTFAAGVNLPTGGILAGKSGALYIAAITHKAGVSVADVLPILGEIDVMTTKGQGYSRSGSLPILSRSNGELGVPAYGAPLTGSVVKHGGQLLKVVSVCRSGATTLLKLATLPPPPVLEQKTAAGLRGGALDFGRPQMVNSIGGPIFPR
jgi:hypothetical protein